MKTPSPDDAIGDQVKAVILAGGFGTRLSEETSVIPKPMVEIGGRPILWHLMKHYAEHGIIDFTIALGYRGEVIKRYFLDYFTLNSDFTVDLQDGSVLVRDGRREDWRVTLVDTGSGTGTGGRLLRLRDQLTETFALTYGDGLGNVDIRELMKFHEQEGPDVTVTAVRPPARFGELTFDAEHRVSIVEKPQLGEGWINGGFMIVEPSALDVLSGDQAGLEVDLLEKLSSEGRVAAMRHAGFWQCVDTARDLRIMREMWDTGRAPWKTWR